MSVSSEEMALASFSSACPPPNNLAWRLRNERPGHRLVEAPRSKHAPRCQHALLQWVENRRGNWMVALHGNRWNIIEAMNAADLFHEIGFAIHIRPPGGHRTFQVFSRSFLHAKAEVRKNALLLGKRKHQARPRFSPVSGAACRSRGVQRRFACNHQMRSRTAAEIKDHLRGNFRAHLREGRINAALKAVARIRNDAELPPRGRGAQGIEIGRFHENICGGFRAARMLAADNAGNAFGGFVIGDHRHRRCERIGLAIKGRDFFAIPRHARPDIALHLVRIEDMQRPAITCFIFLGWLGLYGVPLWGGLVLALIWGFVVFKWV